MPLGHRSSSPGCRSPPPLNRSGVCLYLALTKRARMPTVGARPRLGDVVHLNGTGKGHVRMTGGSGRGAGLGQALRVPEFRALWAAELVSVAGDQLARVGLSVLVFGRTGSAAWAAATYALTFLPALVGGVLLGRLADRHPRRQVMIVCDLVRALLVALMVLPGNAAAPPVRAAGRRRPARPAAHGRSGGPAARRRARSGVRGRARRPARDRPGRPGGRLRRRRAARRHAEPRGRTRPQRSVVRRVGAGRAVRGGAASGARRPCPPARLRDGGPTPTPACAPCWATVAGACSSVRPG